MKHRTVLLVASLLGAFPCAAMASADKYAITAEEHAACDVDVISLCSDVDHDEDSVIGCMKAKRQQLSPVCMASFTAGMRRRHLPM